MHNHRLPRVESLILQILSEIITKRIVRDPRVNQLVTFSYVKLSPDLRNGEVGISGYMSKTALRKSASGLNHAAGFFQSYLSKHMSMRTTPRLHFVIDRSLAHGFETIQKINSATVLLESDQAHTARIDSA